jgi:type II secretory pathway component GspD/PulD (secretin)
MKILLLLPTLLLSCNSLALITPGPASHRGATPDLANRFPAATSNLSVKGGEDGFSLADLLGALSQSTGITISISGESQQSLNDKSAGLISDVEVPAAEAYSFVEALLVSNDFWISSIHGAQTPVIRVSSAKTGSRPQYLRIEASDLGALSGHPALMIETSFEMKNADARQFANSMRQMFPNPNTERCFAFGGSGLLYIGGRAELVTSFVASARAADLAAEGVASDTTGG